MMLYVNGDSHAAGHGIATSAGWACDDPDLWYLGKIPHPANECKSFGAQLGEMLGCSRINYSQSGGSNSRIMRVTKEWIKANPKDLKNVFMLIQWSTWEREEWLHEGVHYQVGASGLDHLPVELHDRYRNFVANVDWKSVAQHAHEMIWNFHNELNRLNIPHLFFNGNSHFGDTHTVNDLMVPIFPEDKKLDWNHCYIEPYSREGTYNQILRKKGFDTIDGYHFGEDAHCVWAKCVLQYILDNKLLRDHALSPD